MTYLFVDDHRTWKSGGKHLVDWDHQSASANKALETYNALSDRLAHNPAYAAQVNDQVRKAEADDERSEADAKEGLYRVTARGVSVVPGAVVCPDLDRVHLMFDVYISHWTDARGEAVAGERWRLLHGSPSPMPDPKDYGCALVPPGTPLSVRHVGVVPVVSGKLSDGTAVQGVTLPQMLVRSSRPLG